MCLIFFQKKRKYWSQLGLFWCPMSKLVWSSPRLRVHRETLILCNDKTHQGQKRTLISFFWVKRWYRKRIVWRKTNDCPIKKNWVQVLRKVEKSKQMSLPLEKQCQFFEKFFWTHYQTLDGTLASEDNYPFLLPPPFFIICFMYCMPASYSFFICHP